MRERYFYSESRLPQGFRLPEEFVNFAQLDNRPELKPWWFMCDFPEFANFWIDQLRKQYPDRVLVPFAKLEDADDLACFDGADLSSSPKVIYIHAFASPGWEMRGEVASFSDWLTLADRDHQDYVKEREN
jgi:hypothetical protein